MQASDLISDSVKEIPVLGDVPGGVPDIKEQYTNIEKTVPHLTTNKQLFALQVVGDSMKKVAPHGQYCIVDPTDRNPKDKDFVIMRIGKQCTFKRYREKPMLRLQPFSTDVSYDDIFYDGEEWEIIGVVVGTINNFR